MEDTPSPLKWLAPKGGGGDGFFCHFVAYFICMYALESLGFDYFSHTHVDFVTTSRSIFDVALNLFGHTLDSLSPFIIIRKKM